MSEWQPARIRPVHAWKFGQGDNISREEWAKDERRIFRVRPTHKRYWPETMAEIGCDATRFFEIHPEDLRDSKGGNLICEHELLTD